MEQRTNETLPPEWYISIDAPDIRDYRYEVTFGSIEPLSDHLPFPVIDIQNQGAKASTRMACGQFALAHVINAQNRIRAAADKTDYIPRDASREWSRLAQKNSTILTEGTTLQSNLADAVSHEAVTGYAVVQTREEIEHALAHQRYIYTGSASGDWKAVRDTKRYKVRRDGKFVGHIIAVGSYTDEWVLAINSYGPRNGIFFIDWQTFLNHFYTKYAICDARDERAFAQYREAIGKRGR